MKARSHLAMLSALLALPITSVQAQQSTTLAPLTVEDTLLEEDGAVILYMDNRNKGPVADGGELLKTIPGVSAARKGGHGLDPSIRGQNQTRLNIVLDGAFVHGGCPNRMDPPSAYGASESYNSVTVLKGAQSVEYGAGGSGGVVLFNRQTETFDADERYRGKAGVGYRGNINALESYLDMASGTPSAFIRFIGNYSDGNDYKDGDNNVVRSSYTESTGNLLLGWTPDAENRVELSHEASYSSDMLYAGAGMDAPYTRNNVTRFKFARGLHDGVMQKLEGQISYSQVAHLMDNYSLRTAPAAAMYMQAPSTSDTLTGKLSLQFNHAGMDWKVGVDHQGNQRDAVRYRGTVGAVTNLQSYLWPDVTTLTTGLFAQLDRPLGETNRLKAGLRYDYVRADAGKTHATPNDAMGALAKLSGHDLYTTYYGGSTDASTEHNMGGFLRYEQGYWGNQGNFYVALSRTVRTADATERYMAANHNTSADSRWVGNPFIKPEKHHQLDVGTRIQWQALKSDVTLFYNRVDDYILQDHQHSAGADGNATVYHNVEATLLGGEAAFTYNFDPHWVGGMSLAYVYGHNETSNQVLAQIAPFEAGFTLDYRADRWDFGGKLRVVTKQTRADTDSTTATGLDTDQTPGFSTLDLYSAYRPMPNLTLKMGVNNLFDKRYAEHLNASNSFDATQLQVNEPGRTLWFTLGTEF
ncbi:TonB-dependent copper receptor [Magnetococcus marinus MC-1]|uniref:TonB-dependent copper receptor n=1 Tax=Magnetococcus marinus (strain ATCC BAA-1437 / JCM 17883 / MC-1) TaxID=156889 RepID=A0LDK2_MAGMM|nr:TonB-dependent copper receptor [Magnetococcus marinus]ABK46045.1 TonB-dependent copper receptor [Magnetococcus marinus MC-1]